MFSRSKAAKKRNEKETAARDSALSFPGLSSSSPPPHPPLYADLVLPLKLPGLVDEPALPTGVVELPAIEDQRVPIIVTEPLEQNAADDPVSFESISAQVSIIIRRLETFRERRPRLLTTQLISIQSCITTWARDRDVVSVGQLESMLNHLPAITRSTMLDVCEKMRQWMRSPERAHLDRTWGLPSQSKTAYFEMMIEGYDTLETLRTVCDSLLTIIPFLTNRPLGLLLRTSPNRIDSLSEEAQATQAGSTRDNTEASQSASESSPSQKTFSIQILYLNCLQALRAVAIMSIDKDRPNVIYSHLVVWGCGLFQASTSLDLILEDDDVESVATFKEHVIGVLADIAVLLDIILRSYDPIVDPEVQKSLYTLQASFGHFKVFSEAAMGEGPDLPEQAEDETNERLLECCLEQLAGLVDCLFDVLPTIDRLRQLCILGIEKRSRELAARMASTPSASVPDRSQRTEPEQRPPMEYEPPARALGAGFEQIPGLEGTSPSNDEPLVGSGYLPSGYNPSPRDELDFWDQPNEVEFSRKGKDAVLSGQKPLDQKPLPFRRGRKAQAHRDSRQKSVRDIVTMDLELAVALRLSLVEMQTQGSKEKQQDQEIMAQLQEWDAEIQRLQGWSDVFHESLGTEPSEAETRRLYSIFEQLARIGATFATSGPGGPTESSFGVKDVEGRLKMAAEAMARSSGQSIDVKLDPSWKSYKEALKTFREANDNIENLG